MLAKLFGVNQDEVAFRLRVSTDHARRLARDPRHAQRVIVAELEAILDQIKNDSTQAVVAGADEGQT
jgi:hypothetical protein